MADDEPEVNEWDYSPWYQSLPSSWTIKAFNPEQRPEPYKEVYYESQDDLAARILKEFRPHGKFSTPSVEHNIHFVKSLRSIFLKGARVMLVKCDTINNGKLLFAKAYDPLFYPRNRRYHSWFGEALERAELEFKREVSAYSALKDFWGKEVPYFYGSYLLELRVNYPDYEEDTRSFPLILTEYLEGGEWMHNMTQTWFNDALSIDTESPAGNQVWEQFKKDTMVKVITTESKIFQRGINHRDCRPANIYIITNHETRMVTRLVINDFGQMEMQDLPYLARYSPLLRWQHAMLRTVEFLYPVITDDGFTTDAWIDWPWEPFLREHWLGSTDYFPVDPDTYKDVGYQWRLKQGLTLVSPTDPSSS
jgi:hypothetical protein